MTRDTISDAAALRAAYDCLRQEAPDQAALLDQVVMQIEHGLVNGAPLRGVGRIGALEILHAVGHSMAHDLFSPWRLRRREGESRETL